MPDFLALAGVGGWCPLLLFGIVRQATKNEYTGLLVFHLVLLLNPWLIDEMWPIKVFSIGGGE